MKVIIEKIETKDLTAFVVSKETGKSKDFIDTYESFELAMQKAKEIESQADFTPSPKRTIVYQTPDYENPSN